MVKKLGFWGKSLGDGGQILGGDVWAIIGGMGVKYGGGDVSPIPPRFAALK